MTRYRFTDTGGVNGHGTMTAVRAPARPAAPATHTHIHIHDHGRRSRDQLDEPGQGTASEEQSCPVQLGDRFRVAGAANGGFALHRDSGTGDEGTGNPLPAREIGFEYPAWPETVEGAVQGARQPETPPDLDRVLGDRKRRIRRIGDAALADLGRPRDPCEEQAALAVWQERLNAHYRNQRG